MNDDIIKVAEACGIPEFQNNENQADNIMRFAALVRADEQKKWEGQTTIEINEAILESKEAMKLALDALEQLDGIDTETECVTIDVGNVITALREALVEQPAQQEIDWKDQYEKQKRRADMWIAKYEADIGPLEKAGPAAAQQEPACRWNREDDDHMPGTWRSDCGVRWTFTDDGPVGNSMKYCCGCGAILKEKNT